VAAYLVPRMRLPEGGGADLTRDQKPRHRELPRGENSGSTRRLLIPRGAGFESYAGSHHTTMAHRISSCGPLLCGRRRLTVIRAAGTRPSEGRHHQAPLRPDERSGAELANATSLSTAGHGQRRDLNGRRCTSGSRAPSARGRCSAALDHEQTEAGHWSKGPWHQRDTALGQRGFLVRDLE